MATRHNCFVQIRPEKFAGNPKFRGKNNDHLRTLIESLNAIDPAYTEENQGREMQWFRIYHLTARAKMSMFLAAFDRVHDLLKNDLEDGSGRLAGSNTTREARLARAWDILTGQAKKNVLHEAQITYTDFRNKVLERDPEHLLLGTGTNSYLHPIQNICKASKLPRLTGLVMSSTSKLPRSGYDGTTAEEAYAGHMKEVLAYDWASEQNPWIEAGSGEVVDTKQLVRDLLQHPGRPATYTRIPARLRQSVFRSALLNAYAGKCAVCDINNKVLLDAAHIKAYAACEVVEEGDVTNGILLCKNHHASFDGGLWWLTDELTIATTDKFSKTAFGKAMQEFTPPASTKHRPSSIYLNYHRRSIKPVRSGSES